MRGAIFRDGQIRVDTLPDPVPEQGQVLVKTLRCGICGSGPGLARQSPGPHTRRLRRLARNDSGTGRILAKKSSEERAT